MAEAYIMNASAISLTMTEFFTFYLDSSGSNVREFFYKKDQ